MAGPFDFDETQSDVAKQALLELLPFALPGIGGAVGAGVGKLVGKGAGSVIKGGATGAALGVPFVADDVLAAGKKADKKADKSAPAAAPPVADDAAIMNAIGSDPSAQALYSQLKGAQAAHSAAMTDPSVSKGGREDLGRRVSDLQTQLNAKLEQLNAGRRPFDKAHPEMAALWPAVQIGAPALAGAAVKGIGDFLTMGKAGRWRAALAAGEKAWGNADIGKAAAEAGKVGNYLKDASTPFGSVSKAAKTLAPTVAAAGVGAEAAAFPHQYNLQNTDPNSAEYKASAKALDHGHMVESLAPFAGIGALTGTTAAKLVPTWSRNLKPESKAFLDRFSDGKQSQGIGDVIKSALLGPSVKPYSDLVKGGKTNIVDTIKAQGSIDSAKINADLAKDGASTNLSATKMRNAASLDDLAANIDAKRAARPGLLQAQSDGKLALQRTRNDGGIARQKAADDLYIAQQGEVAKRAALKTREQEAGVVGKELGNKLKEHRIADYSSHGHAAKKDYAARMKEFEDRLSNDPAVAKTYGDMLHQYRDTKNGGVVSSANAGRLWTMVGDGGPKPAWFNKMLYKHSQQGGQKIVDHLRESMKTDPSDLGRLIRGEKLPRDRIDAVRQQLSGYQLTPDEINAVLKH